MNTLTKYNKLHISCLALWKRYLPLSYPSPTTPTNRSHGHVVKTDDVVFCLKLIFTSHREIWKVPRRRGPEAFPPPQICIFNPQPSPDTEPSDCRNTKWRFKGWVGLCGGGWLNSAPIWEPVSNGRRISLQRCCIPNGPWEPGSAKWMRISRMPTREPSARVHSQ